MTATAQDIWQEQADDAVIRIDGRIDPDREDQYWQSAYWSQAFFNGQLDYEDFAPAFCVGYCGFAQYGGAFDDAEKSLIANWLRIKGESRLGLDGAMQAIRAAWQHAARSDEPQEEEAELDSMELARMTPQISQRQPAMAMA